MTTIVSTFLTGQGPLIMTETGVIKGPFLFLHLKDVILTACPDLKKNWEQAKSPDYGLATGELHSFAMFPIQIGSLQMELYSILNFNVVKGEYIGIMGNPVNTADNLIYLDKCRYYKNNNV